MTKIQEKMKAMVLGKVAPIETRPLKLKLIDKPAIRKGNHLLLELQACGVCRSNLHLIEGDWKEFGVPSSLPIVPGQDVVGVVMQI